MNMMKRILCLFVTTFVFIHVITSCSKENTPTAPSLSPVGTWIGTGQYGNTLGNPTYVFSLTFKSNGTIDILGNNSTGIDNATGTWQLVQDSVKAFYKYTGSSANYTLSAKYVSTSTSLVGTIGLETATTGVGLFSVIRQ